MFLLGHIHSTILPMPIAMGKLKLKNLGKTMDEGRLRKMGSEKLNSGKTQKLNDHLQR